jgi:dipeptidyl aminopeptidase/acylaminoacyl peptidase
MAEDLYLLNTVSEVRLAPDGQNVIYTVQRVDKKTEKKYTNLWVAPVSGGEPRQFTSGDQHDAGGRWSPDGKLIAFLSDRGDKEKPAQIHLLPFNGGEASRLSQIDGEIGEMSWSPDGKQILCTVRKLDAEALERQKDEQKKKLGIVSRHYDRLFYKLDGYGYLPHERTHI